MLQTGGTLKKKAVVYGLNYSYNLLSLYDVFFSPMSAIILENISKDLLRWAFQRAGFSQEQAIGVFPLLEDWLNDVKKPTASQLRKYANYFHAPLGFLVLEEVPMESLLFPMFGSPSEATDYFDLDVYDTAMEISRRQDWLEDYLVENEIEICKFVGSLTFKNTVTEAVDLLRSILNLESYWVCGMKEAEKALDLLVPRLEEAGVFIAISDIVGNDPRRPLKVPQCRGFALANKIAPYIFLNSSYSACGQIYTLINECVHLMLGLSAGHAGEWEPLSDPGEDFCHNVTMEFLLPEDKFLKSWKADFKILSKDFKVSDLLRVRRACDLGVLSEKDYTTFVNEHKSQPLLISVKKEGVGK